MKVNKNAIGSTFLSGYIMGDTDGNQYRSIVLEMVPIMTDEVSFLYQNAQFCYSR